MLARAPRAFAGRSVEGLRRDPVRAELAHLDQLRHGDAADGGVELLLVMVIEEGLVEPE